ncbi:hypothetical protein ABTH98_20130, partial [Acinetobacter baumannii]
AGFARSREDITALGDSFGNMLTSPVRDAPPMARTAPVPALELPRTAAEPPYDDSPRYEETQRARAPAPNPQPPRAQTPPKAQAQQGQAAR